MRIAHQPNFAAYLKIVSLFMIAEELAPKMDTVSAYIMNDCDVVINERFSRTILPDLIHPRGGRYISVRQASTPSSLVLFRAPVPPIDWLTSTTRLIRENAETEARFLKKTYRNTPIPTDGVIDDIQFAWSAADNLSHMTGILLSRIVNLRLELGTVFLPGHELWASAGPIVGSAILSRWPEIVKAQLSVASQVTDAGLDLNLAWLTSESLAPFWWVCTCGSRVSLKFENDRDPLLGLCARCGDAIRIRSSTVASATERGRLIPRVGALDLAENMANELRAGITYVSSASHSLIAALVASKIGVPTLPQIFVNAHGFFGTPIERVADSAPFLSRAVGWGEARKIIGEGRASSIYHATRAPTKSLVHSIRAWALNQELDDPMTIPT
jgi:hypothetical protein